MTSEWGWGREMERRSSRAAGVGAAAAPSLSLFLSLFPSGLSLVRYFRHFVLIYLPFGGLFINPSSSLLL